MSWKGSVKRSCGWCLSSAFVEKRYLDISEVCRRCVTGTLPQRFIIEDPFVLLWLCLLAVSMYAPLITPIMRACSPEGRKRRCLAVRRMRKRQDNHHCASAAFVR